MLLPKGIDGLDTGHTVFQRDLIEAIEQGQNLIGINPRAADRRGDVVAVTQLIDEPFGKWPPT